MAVACFHKSFLALNDLGGHIGGTNVLETNPCKAKKGILLIAMPHRPIYTYMVMAKLMPNFIVMHCH